MNSNYDSILSRRSIRKYKPEMPEKEDLQKVIEAGLYAASGRNGQSSIVAAVTNLELRNRLSKLNGKLGGWPDDTEAKPRRGGCVLWAE